MAADALTPCVVRSLAAIVFTMLEEQGPVSLTTFCQQIKFN